MSEDLFGKSIQKPGVLSGFLEYAKLGCQSQESNLTRDFSNPSVGKSSLQMNWSWKLFTQSYLNLESFNLYQCGCLWEQTPPGTTEHSQCFMCKHDCFKDMITAGPSPASTQVCLLLWRCIQALWEQGSGKDAVLCTESFSRYRVLRWLLIGSNPGLMFIHTQAFSSS